MDFHFQKPSSSVLTDKKLYVFDMDGTVYLGNRVFDFAVRLIRLLRRLGKQVLFFTNNASHTTSFYVEKLRRMGFEPLPGEMMTSGDVTAEFLLRHRAGKTVYLVGTSELIADFRGRGIPLCNGDEASADIVITSFDTELTYEKLNAACRFIRGGAEYLSTHPDFNCPTETGFIPDSGAIAAFVTASTGKTPVYFGKPYEQTIAMIKASKGHNDGTQVFMALHKGMDGFMSDEHYREYYWSHLQQIIAAIVEANKIPYIFTEGKYNSRLECLKEVEPGKTLYHFEEVDMVEAKKVLGDVACITGGFDNTLLTFGTEQQVIDACKKMLDDCAPGGGFIFQTKSSLVGDAKQENGKPCSAPSGSTANIKANRNCPAAILRGDCKGDTL